MVRKDLIECEGCGKLTRPEKLSFDNEGRALCAGCNEAAITDKASWLKRKPKQPRRCRICGHVVRPTSAGGGYYQCECGYTFSLDGTAGVSVWGVAGALSSWLSGLALSADAYVPALLAAGFALIMVVKIVREFVTRVRNPPVR